MKDWTPRQIADATGAELAGPAGAGSGPERVSIDSRDAGPGTLFVGLKGEHVDGGRYASLALAGGAWGVLVAPEHAQLAQRTATERQVVLGVKEPLPALHQLATAWRQHLGAQVIGVTGSTGKTSTKDMINALLAPHRRTVASRANFNTEIGLPLEILAAPQGTEVLVLEMGMRGAGQIAELAAIAQPDVGVIVSIGPVHLELLGSIEAIAAAKAELIAGLKPGGTAVVPADEPLLRPHLRADVVTRTFGEGGDVQLARGDGQHLLITTPDGAIELDVPFTQAHLRTDLLAAVAAAQAVGVVPGGQLDVVISPGRGQRSTLASGITLIDDCYNANPMSMRAALDDLAETATGHDGARSVAILGDMLELGPDEVRFHEEIGAHAGAANVDLLITVGPLAAAMTSGYRGEAHHADNAADAAKLAEDLLRPGDIVLVKASRGVGLELVCRAISAGVPA